MRGRRGRPPGDRGVALQAGFSSGVLQLGLGTVRAGCRPARRRGSKDSGSEERRGADVGSWRGGYGDRGGRPGAALRNAE